MDFVGLPVVVTLVQPPNTAIRGRVLQVDESTLTLYLQDAVHLPTGQKIADYRVEGRNIADIKVEKGNPQHPPNTPSAPPLPHTQNPTPQIPPQQHQPPPRSQWPQYQQGPLPYPISMPRGPPVMGHVQLQSPLTAVPPPPQPRNMPPSQIKQSFVDPAILSMARPPLPTTRTPGPNPIANILLQNTLQEAPATPIKPLAEAAAAVPSSKPLHAPPSRKTTILGQKRENIAATLTEPFSGMDMGEDHDDEDTDDGLAKDGPARRVSLTKTRTGKPMESPAKPDEDWKRTRRGGKGRPRKKKSTLPNADASPEVSRNPGNGTTTQGKGWRQTPLLQEDEPQASKTPGLISGKVGLAAVSALSKKEKRQKYLEKKNGWATEDATDIQELPEFDFENNLAKFDKRTVFNQIRNDDTTADEDRLVSINRVQHRPGTHGGKNLHYTENVLDGTKSRPFTRSHSSESDSEFGSGQNSKRAMSRASSRRNPQRTGSGVLPENLPTHQTTVSLLARNKSSLSGQTYASSHATGSPKNTARNTPPDSPFTPVQASRPASLRVVSTNRTCHTLTPAKMSTVEEAAEADFGITEDMMAENAGRGIAEVALSAINPGGRRLARENVNLNSRPVIVFLVGNHRSGARAVAAARHLLSRGIRVMVSILGYSRGHDHLDKHLRRQIEIFHNYGGITRSWPDTETALKQLRAPPELIIDALLGRDREYDALGANDQKEVLHVIGWANKSRAGVLAVEGPSGVGANTGEISILEGEPLELRAKHVVCLGAPRTGLLRALDTGASGAEWVIWVVDIGLNKPWKSAGISGNRAVPFGSEWIIKVEYATASRQPLDGN